MSLKLTTAYSGLKHCRPFHTVALRVPNRTFTDFTLYNINFECHNRPSAGYAPEANNIRSDTGIFKERSLLNNDLTGADIFTKILNS